MNLLNENNLSDKHKINVNTSYKHTNQLTTTVYDNTTLNTTTEQRNKLKTLYKLSTELYLRDPFKKLSPIFLSKYNFKQIANLNNMKNIETSIKYMELDSKTLPN